MQYTYDKRKKITDHNEQRAKRERGLLLLLLKRESGLLKTSLIFFANETVAF